MPNLPLGRNREAYDEKTINDLLGKTQEALARRRDESRLQPEVAPVKSFADTELVRKLTQAVTAFSDGKEVKSRWEQHAPVQLYEHLAVLAPEAARAVMPVVLEHADPDQMTALLAITREAAQRAAPTPEMAASLEKLQKYYIGEEAKKKINEAGVAACLLVLQGLCEPVNPGGFKAALDEILKENTKRSGTILFMASLEKPDLFPKSSEITREDFLRVAIKKVRESQQPMALRKMREVIGEELFDKLAQ